MLWIYNIGILGYLLILKFAALFNAKAKLFIEGRKNIFETLKARLNTNEEVIWFHFASLGEFEQGRPVLEKLKANDPAQKIVVTFFSPSGYEIRKNYALADVFYLPLDTAANAKKFIEIVNPKMAVFTKYEFWFHYFKTLNDKQIPLYLISGIFRPDQVFFKGHGGFYRGILKFVTHFFVQNEESVLLLKSIGLGNVSLSGDTRFDRVYEHAKKPKNIIEIETFCGNSPVLIGGSTWPEDEKVLVALTEQYPDWKFIIAPHEIDESHVKEIEHLFPNSVRFSKFNSELKDESLKLKGNPQTLIIDNIGMLSSLYQYASIAYIGGGFGAGIHNTLEAAAFGLPVIFGPKYEKFQEANDLMTIGAARSITTKARLLNAFHFYIDNTKAGEAAKNYVAIKKGATAMIVDSLNQKP
jgi:3-deoxy-D-manno-octulosonic-acid transferase